MTTPQERLQDDIKAALKAGDKERLATVRLLLGEIKNERIRTGVDVDETTFLTLVQRAIKRRREAADQYGKGGRPELADKESREAGILGEYLPPPASEAELREAAVATAQELQASGPRDMGPMMKALREQFAGRADGKTLQSIVAEVLSRFDSSASAS
jgi:uncharacterized protein YqeY